MKDNYQLHLEGTVIENTSFASLKRLAENNSGPYEIYLIKPSKMNSKKFFGYKLNDGDVEDALTMLRRGKTKIYVANHFHVSRDTLNKAIKLYETTHQTILG